MSEVKVISPAHLLNACDKKCGAAATGTHWERSIEREGGVGLGGLSRNRKKGGGVGGGRGLGTAD